ncbi:hypothetical protein POM88_010400 [Heracleum sosnowskyi]|uniref:Uncharacterized protein n=1 Tax=Heracleum sosnowskyi TaxID=360622 RepID=A0AAD8ISI1_9APIA|nr:hypothetical protein POM88_010400 [Heracleum sosnowskyi]
MPPNWGESFFGIALWVVFKCKTTDRNPYIRAFITNASMGITKSYRFYLLTANIGEEVQSRVECIEADKIMVRSGDVIMVWFESSLYFTYDGGTFGGAEVPAGELAVEMCGAHIIQKNTLL